MAANIIHSEMKFWSAEIHLEVINKNNKNKNLNSLLLVLKMAYIFSVGYFLYSYS